MKIYDICIVGSGPAGLTLSAELAKSGKTICILESGDKHKTSKADNLREVKSDGEISIKSSSRERVFGGTSTTWAGLSSPLDRIDFIDRPYLTHRTFWPISQNDLKKYYERASHYGFPSLDRYNSKHMQDLKESGSLKIPEKYLQEKIFIAGDPPWNFGKKLSWLTEEPNVHLFLDTTVTKLLAEKSMSGSKVTGAHFIKSDGEKETIYAKDFILCAGGLENVRILLNSKDTSQTGLGNEFDQVGRYLMNHPKDNYGLLHLNKPVTKLPYFFGFLKEGFAEYAGIRLNEETQMKLGVLNSYIRFEPIFPWTDNAGVRALITMTKQIKFFLDWWKKKQKQLIHLRDYNETGDDLKNEAPKEKINLLKNMGEIFLNPGAVTSYVYHRLFQDKELPVKTIRLRNFMDMEPNPDNRLILSKDLDQNGELVPMVTLNTSPLDRRSVIELHRIFGEEIEKNNIGRLESHISKAKPWPIKHEASHHLGGARMGLDAQTSVVNENLRVHSVENLYVCGAAVFPTAGSANPTYTICALAIRLADHLKKI